MWNYIPSACVLCMLVNYGQSIEISPRSSLFSSELSSSDIFKRPTEIFHPMEENGVKSDKLKTYKKTTIIKDGQKQEENVICKEDMCIVTVDANISDKKGKGTNTVSTDVHVIVSSDVSTKKEEKNDSDNSDTSADVPVFKGYNGVSFDDINWKEDPTEKEEKPKKENEEPSSIITSPYNGEKIIINPGKAPEKPVDHLMPPKDDWNSKYPNNNNDGSRGARIPSGWSSNWKPSYPTPGDYHHYHVHNDRRDFAGYEPTYRNVCKCVREPVYPRRSDFYPTRPVNHWYPTETTTKKIVDDKLTPPFSVKQKRNIYVMQ